MAENSCFYLLGGLGKLSCLNSKGGNSGQLFEFMAFLHLPNKKDCNMAYIQLASEQRSYIFKHYRNQSLSQIVRTIGCHTFTVSREIRQYTVNRTYCYRQARQSSEAQKKNKTACKMMDAVRQTIAELITRKYSPEQVCIHFRKHEGIKLHHSTVCRYLAKDRKNGDSLYINLRIVSKPYRRKYGSGAWTKEKSAGPNRYRRASGYCRQVKSVSAVSR